MVKNSMTVNCLLFVDTWQYLTCHVMSCLAGRGVNQVPTQGQVTLGPDLVAVRIPAPVLASQVPAVAARVHHHQELISPAPLTGTVTHFVVSNSLSSHSLHQKCKVEMESDTVKANKVDRSREEIFHYCIESYLLLYVCNVYALQGGTAAQSILFLSFYAYLSSYKFMRHMS